MSIAINDMREVNYFRNGDGYVSVENDAYAENPLSNYEPVGTFLTWGNRYISPSNNPYSTPSDFLIAAVGEAREFSCETMQDALYALDEAGYAACGIYRFEHGGVEYALGSENPFRDSWDSGPVGFAFVAPDTLVTEGIDKETAVAYMKEELKQYSAWANGKVFLATEYDAHGEELELRVYYGLDEFENDHPDIEPIDVPIGKTIQEYAENNLLSAELQNEWSFKTADESFLRDTYVNYPFALVADNGNKNWRIVDTRINYVSFATFSTPQEALKQLNLYLTNTKDAIEAFIPPKTVFDRPVDDLVKEAKERTIEKNEVRAEQYKEHHAPDISR